MVCEKVFNKEKFRLKYMSMKILIAEDDPVSRRILQMTLSSAGYDVVVTQNGLDALAVLESENSPKLAVLDWMMPEMDGLDVCRRIRQTQTVVPVYIILLTAKGRKSDIVQGFEAGANDYVIKPFDREELIARVKVGETVVNLQKSLATQVKELENALARVEQLQGILPICSYCKNVRDDQNYWQEVETYVSKHTSAEFSHSVCPDCYVKNIQPQLDKRKLKNSI
jgi:sigma-B regulation protein RsbU (phosphoserine phosphatase)